MNNDTRVLVVCFFHCKNKTFLEMRKRVVLENGVGNDESCQSEVADSLQFCGKGSVSGPARDIAISGPSNKRKPLRR